MRYMKVEILRITDYSSSPGWVECLLVEASGNRYTFNEKSPTVSSDSEYIEPSSKFPQDGFIRCEMIKEHVDVRGRRIFTVSTEKPDHVKSINGSDKFDLLSCQLEEHIR